MRRYNTTALCNTLSRYWYTEVLWLTLNVPLSTNQSRLRIPNARVWLMHAGSMLVHLEFERRSRNKFAALLLLHRQQDGAATEPRGALIGAPPLQRQPVGSLLSWDLLHMCAVARWWARAVVSHPLFGKAPYRFSPFGQMPIFHCFNW